MQEIVDRNIHAEVLAGSCYVPAVTKLVKTNQDEFMVKKTAVPFKIFAGLNHSMI